MENGKNDKQSSETLGLKEPHLVDITNLLEIAQWLIVWLGSAATAGVVGSLSTDAVKKLIKSLRENDGPSRISELEQKILELHRDSTTSDESADEEFEIRLHYLLDEFK